MSAPPGSVRFRIQNLDREFDAARGAPLLATALAAGLNLPHSCRSGNCGSCAARLIRGDIDYPDGIPLGLSEQQRAHKWVLLCQARPRGDVEVEVELPMPAGELAIKRLPARIEHCELLAHDVMRVMLRLPLAEEFRHQAGQYVDVLLPGGRRRSFSIASAPQGPPLLELHVRHVPGGEFTGALFAQPQQKRLVNIEGPLGQFVYRESTARMLLIGGGTGLAPLDAIIRHVQARGLGRRMSLFWGCRARRDLYADQRLRGLLDAGVLEHYVPVLSEPDDAWQGERGWVHEAVLRRWHSPARRSAPRFCSSTAAGMKGRRSTRSNRNRRRRPATSSTSSCATRRWRRGAPWSSTSTCRPTRPTAAATTPTSRCSTPTGRSRRSTER